MLCAFCSGRQLHHFCACLKMFCSYIRTQRNSLSNVTLEAELHTHTHMHRHSFTFLCGPYNTTHFSDLEIDLRCIHINIMITANRDDRLLFELYGIIYQGWESKTGSKLFDPLESYASEFIISFLSVPACFLTVTTASQLSSVSVTTGKYPVL